MRVSSVVSMGVLSVQVSMGYGLWAAPRELDECACTLQPVPYSTWLKLQGDEPAAAGKEATKATFTNAAGC